MEKEKQRWSGGLCRDNVLNLALDLKGKFEPVQE